MICLESGSKELQSSGLVILNKTVLTYFSSEQRAELFRLKGLFMARLDDQRHGAEAVLSHAVQTCPQYAKAWLAWGRYSDELLQLPQAGVEEGPGGKRSALALNAMACYLEAVNTGSQGGRLLLPRLLQLLEEHGGEQGLGLMEKHGPLLPEWVWLPWVPQLLALVAQGGAVASALSPLLQQLQHKYPQALYYPLRTAHLTRKQAHAALLQSQDPLPPASEALLPPVLAAHVALDAGKTSLTRSVTLKWVGGPEAATTTQEPIKELGAGTSVAALRECLDKGYRLLWGSGAEAQGARTLQELWAHLRQTHPLLCQDLEALCMCVSSAVEAGNSVEEEVLLRGLHAITTTLLGASTLPLDAPLPAPLQRRLTTLAARCFAPLPASVPPMPQQQAQRSAFVSRYKASFHQDVLSGPLTVQDAITRLSKWKALLLHAALQPQASSPALPLHLYRYAPQRATPPPPPPQDDFPSPPPAPSAAAPSTAAPATTTPSPAPSSAPPSAPASPSTAPSTTAAAPAAAASAPSPSPAPAPAPVAPARAAPVPPSPRSSSSPSSSAPGAWWQQGGVEVPGQYCRGAGSPHPEVHAKLLTLSPQVQLLARDHGYCVLQRRLWFLANDGRRYSLTAQLPLEPSPPRALDERVAQLHWLVNRLLERNGQSQRRCLQLSGPVVVALGPGVRLHEDDPHALSLGQVYDAQCLTSAADPEAPVLYVRKRCSAVLAQARQDVLNEQNERARAVAAFSQQPPPPPPPTPVEGQEQAGEPTPMQVDPPEPPPAPLTGAALETAIQARIKQRVTQEAQAAWAELASGEALGPTVGALLQRSSLLKHMQSSLGEEEAVWAWQRSLAQQLGLTSLLCYATAATQRHPHTVLLHTTSARMLSTSLRLSSPQALEAAVAQALGTGPLASLDVLGPQEEVPFRLSPWLLGALSSPLLVDGVLGVAMACAAQALCTKRHLLQPFLTLLLRDELLNALHALPSASQLSDVDLARVQSRLLSVAQGSVAKALERLSLLAPPLPNGLVSSSILGLASAPAADASTELPLDHRVTALLEQASSTTRLAAMPPTWYPAI
jgi:hypothetical protein